LITGLDDPPAVDPKRVGAKAAALAIARQGGLPVLPGFVVEATASDEHMKMGASALTNRGSGGARLAVISVPPRAAARLVAAGRRLSSALAVRSSPPIGSDGKWAGAFTSYIDVRPEELPKAVAGCWASAFSVDALARQRWLGIEPGSLSMAVLIQPAIEAVLGGVAEISPDGSLKVEAVTGSPASLLQGWARGAMATCRPGNNWAGDEAIALVGTETLEQLASALDAARERYGYDRCEWGVAGSLWILQLGNVARPLSSDDDPAVVGGTGVGDPLSAAAVLEQGVKSWGVPASPGVGIGIRHHVNLGDAAGPPRAVITAASAFPSLSQLIWNSAGLVTDLGSPTAHVFEAARSLRIPAVCGVDLGSGFDQIVAVDGYAGLVATLSLA
jgi:phosphoenolpyruvate synthase/pyruvate phosphate dikinase